MDSITKASGRVVWIDVTKGAGIIFVVLGHVISDKSINSAIFLFHMPLFFMVSGLTFGVQPLKQLITKRTWQLLVPYCSYLILVYLADNVVSQFSGIEPAVSFTGVPFLLARGVFGGLALKGVFGVFWFVTCLFMAQIVLTFLVRRFGLTNPWTILVICLFVSGSFLIPAGAVTPWAIASLPHGLLFVWIGALLSAYEMPTWFLGLVGGLVASITVPFTNDFDMKYVQNGIAGINILAAISISLIVISFAQYISKSAIAASIFSSVGAASLVIMFLHQTINFHLKPFVDEWLVVAFAVLFPYVLFNNFKQTTITRKCFLVHDLKLRWNFAHQIQSYKFSI